MSRTRQQKLVIALTAAFLALAYVCLGYAVCAGVPQVTESVSTTTVSGERSPFSKSELVQGASATRDYSFGSHDAEAYYATIADMNRAADTPYADADTAQLMSAPEQYSITPEQLAHLDDVFDVSSMLMLPIIGIACIAAFLVMATLRQFGVRCVARSLLWGGVFVLGVMALFGIWALVSFDSLFGAMHSMLFADGSWVFAADSLLITMLPEAFWAGMAGVWLAISASLAAISLVMGVVLSRRHPKDVPQRGSSSESASA